MLIADLILAVAAIYAFFWAAYVLALPMWARLRGAQRDATLWPSNADHLHIAILVPAHDMQGELGRCIASLQSSGYPPDRLEIYVVADHCSDDTAAVAIRMGAKALERNDDPPGKSYAIAWALEQLAKHGIDPDLYVIVDATVEVHPGFLDALAVRARNGADIIVGHAFVDPSKQQWFIRCMGLTLAHRRLQNESRERLGLSSLIEGRGMAYSRSYIKRFGWSLAMPETALGGSHPTEDWRHGVRAVGNGYRVAFAAGARVSTPLRSTLAAASKQGLRWERGRIGNASSYGLGLLREGVKERDRLKIFAALDSIQPPVAVLAGLSLLVLVSATLVKGTSAGVLAFGLPALMAGCYATMVIARGRRDGIALWTLIWAPVYLVWRCLIFAASFVRTDRFRRGRSAGEQGER